MKDILQTSPTPTPQRLRVGTALLAAIVPMLLVLPVGAWAASAAVTATAKYDKKLAKVVVAGKTATTIGLGAKVSVYDTATQLMLYSAQTDAKKTFNLKLLGANDVPCMVRVEVTDPNTHLVNPINVNVTGAPSCARPALDCAIIDVASKKPVSDKLIYEGDVLALAAALPAAKKTTPATTQVWDMGDGRPSPDAAKVNSGYAFEHAGQYRVTVKVTDTQNKSCTDELVVSVAPKGNFPPKVAEATAPQLKSAMPTAAGKNDVEAYVVMPFEEGAMMSGTLINEPYNAYPNFNALNAQVYQKIKQKPRLVDTSSLRVFYSAASNAKDPVGSDSITSTSQNYFASSAVGANFDYDQTASKKETIYLPNQDFNQAVIKKSQFWDKMRQPVAVKVLGLKEQGTSVADTIVGAFTPAKTLPRVDEGREGQIDKGARKRAMPGVAGAYLKNDPQPFDYNGDLQKFTAQFIPSTNIDDKGRTNPYPLMRVEAKDPAKNNAVVAAADAVYTTAGESRCRECHNKDKIAAPSDLWRTPVVETELKNADGTPGPATGAGKFAPGKNPAMLWPPALHNRFDAINPFAPTVAQIVVKPADEAKIGITRDQNNLRKDRVKASRWINSAGVVAATKPNDNDTSWKLQLQLNFKSGEDYMLPGATAPTWQDDEKAAEWNMLLLHDYQVWLGLTVFNPPYAFSTQLLDSLEDLRAAARGRNVNFCYSTCHISEMRRESSWSDRGYVYRYSDYSKAEHAFHAKLQVYSKKVDKGADGKAHEVGELIRDERGHPVMWGGRGWDSQKTDDYAVGQAIDKTTGKATPWGWDVTKNNWRPDLYPKHSDGMPILPFGDNVPMEKNCLTCHSGPAEKSYRDVHHGAGLKCDDCHGDMNAAGNLYPNDNYDFNLWGAGVYTDGTQHFRRPWMDNPDCGSCHTGDANLKEAGLDYYSAGALRKGYLKTDPAQRSMDPLNARFAVIPTVENQYEKVSGSNPTAFAAKPVSQVLYRKSQDVHSLGVNGTT
ncbi:MAG: PKD domain-containing protein, partial [Methylococcaceae bacterium]|nr:PKD domain-containing protein [Methylococcaceae bacterium]